MDLWIFRYTIENCLAAIVTRWTAKTKQNKEPNSARSREIEKD